MTVEKHEEQERNRGNNKSKKEKRVRIFLSGGLNVNVCSRQMSSTVCSNTMCTLGGN